jgi:hypothetical protein
MIEAAVESAPRSEKSAKDKNQTKDKRCYFLPILDRNDVDAEFRHCIPSTRLNCRADFMPGGTSAGC